MRASLPDLPAMSLPALLLILCGCGAPPDSQKSRSGAAISVSRVEEARDLSKEDCEAFARRIEQSIGASDPSFVREQMNTRALVGTVTHGLGLTDQERSDYLRAISRDLDFGAQVCRAVAVNGSYRLLRIREVDGARRPIFRMIAGGGLNYHEMRLTRDDKGKISIIDVYVFLSGELLSQSFRRTLLPMAAEHKGGGLEGLEAQENDFIRHFKKIARFQRHVKQGLHERALKVFDALPESVRNDKAMLLLRMRAAKHAGDEAYMRALADLKRVFPDDSGLELALFDYYLLTNKYDQALASIERVDQQVAGDPFLGSYRAKVYLMQQKFKASREEAMRALNAEVEVPEPFFILFQVALNEKAHADAVKWLDKLQKNFGFVPPNLENEKVFEAFVKSDAYQAWKKKSKNAEVPRKK